jgi:hypothetical protein
VEVKIMVLGEILRAPLVVVTLVAIRCIAAESPTRE